MYMVTLTQFKLSLLLFRVMVRKCLDNKHIAHICYRGWKPALSAAPPGRTEHQCAHLSCTHAEREEYAGRHIIHVCTCKLCTGKYEDCFCDFIIHTYACIISKQ